MFGFMLAESKAFLISLFIDVFIWNSVL